MGDGYAVIGHRNLLIFCPPDAGHNIFAVKHAGAALDDQIVRMQVLWKIRPAYDVHGQAFSKALFEHPGDLFPSDVFL